MKLIVITMAFIAGIHSCSRMNNSNVTNTNNVSQQDDNRFKNSMITMRRTECFGACPIDSISISGTGKAVYNGIRYTKREGLYEKQLSEKETNQLFNKFECSNFSDFQSEYTAPVSDVPTIYLTFKHRNFNKTVKDYYNSPEELKELEKLVIEVIDSEGWKKVNSDQ